MFKARCTVRVAVFGLGYVGCVSAACLARDGHVVMGVDVSAPKVDAVAAGRSPLIEPGLNDLIGEMVRAGRLRATSDSRMAVHQSEVSLICVGTPGNGNGRLDLQFVQNVCQQIGAALATHEAYHVVVVRSTVLPGTVEDILIPLLEGASGRVAGKDFGVCMNPEFLREGTALQDYYAPSHVIIGELDQASGDRVACLYRALDAQMRRTSIRTAELLKYVNNAFHAVKVVFANEVGAMCKAHGIDGQELMELFCEDRRLNISPAYLKPGFAFGGSCLPKDLRALLYRAKERDLECPMLGAALLSNQQQIERGIRMVENTGCKKIGILGLSFKASTDDVRESPVVGLVETLTGRGYQVCIYDDTVDPSRLIGANRVFLERELPHIASLMRPSIDDVTSEAEVVVVTNTSSAFREVGCGMRENQILIDLAGTARNNGHSSARYEGINW
jgi:GDP-mannose 6-dehydrogenase